MDKLFLLITGPIAVGKMTVGKAIADLAGYVLFHNHHSIEVAHQLFHWGTTDFIKVNEGIRELVFQTALESEEIKGLVFTLVMDFDLKEDWDYLFKIQERFSGVGWSFKVLELEASMKSRLLRNKSAYRLDQKRTKRDLLNSESNLLDSEEQHRMNSRADERIQDFTWMYINNEEKTPEEVASVYSKYTDQAI